MALELESKIKQLTDIARELYRLGVTADGDMGEQLRQLSQGLKDAAGYISGAMPLTAEAEEHFKLARFAANAPGYFYTLVLSPDGRWYMPFASPGIWDVHGLDPASVTEDASPFVALTHPDDVEMAFRLAENSAHDLTPYHVEYRILHPHKGERWIECRAKPQRELDGSTVWHGFMHDITSRKQVEGMLRFIAQRDDLNHAEDFCTALARQLAATLGVAYVVIDRLAEEPGIAETVALHVPTGIAPNLRYPLAGTPCENVMGRKLCSYPQDIQAMFPADVMLVDMGAQSYAGVPLWDSTGRAIGLIAVLDNKPMTDMALVESVLQAAAPAAAAALERAQSERELRDREQRFRSLAENLPLAISRLDRKNDYRYIYINPAHERLLGTTVDDVEMRLSDEDHAELRALIELAASTGEPQQLRMPVRTRDGDLQIHEVSLIPERDAQHEVVSILCLGQDVTNQLQLQEAMATSEHLFRSLAENLPDNIARWDPAGNYLYVNPALERTLGIPGTELIGRRFTTTPDAELHMAIAYVFASGKGSTVRYPIRPPGGEEQIHDIKLIPERNKAGQIVSVLGIGRDVTMQARAEAALRTSEQQFRSLAEHSLDSVVRWDCGRRILYVNPAHAQVLGKPAEELIGTVSDDVKYPEIARAIEQVARTGEALRFARQSVVISNGETRMHEVTLIPERDENGAIVSVLGIGRDVTEQVRAQEALIANEKQFRSLAENMPDNVVRWDTQGRYLYINPAHERTLGKAANEVVGTTLPKSHDRVWAAFPLIQATGDGMPRIRQNLTYPDGSLAVHEVSIIPEWGPDGKIATFLGIGRDMTEQARMEEALSASERQFRTLAENLPNNIIRYSTDARVLYANPAAEKTIGQPMERLLGTAPHERPQFRFHEEYEKRIAQAARGEPSQMEVFSPAADGKEGWYLIDFNPERNQKGEVTSVLVVSHDITARKNTEIDLTMAASVFNAASEAIVITSPSGEILRVNPAFSRITGYPLNAVAHQHPRMLEAGQRHEAFYEGVATTLLTQGTWSGEVDARRRDGEPFTARLSISAVHGKEGEVIHYVGIFSDISQFKRHEIQLQYTAHHDPLTGLPNRILLTDRLHQAIAQAHRAGNMLAVLFIDLDGFKPINDRFGHRAGDHTLVEMALRMASTLRAGDTVARIGGDEFIVLLPGLTNVAECEASTRRLLKAIAEPLEVANCRFTLTASIGIALYPDDADDPDSLLRHADEAMYTAKRTGRSQYVFSYNSGQRGDSRLDGNLVHELRVALEQHQIEVHYQPIVDFSTGRVTKAEALVRWRHPERGLIPPVEFIPLAEDSGLIHAIGNQVFAQTLEVAQRWNQRCPEGGLRRISVNRSPREFLDPTGIEDWMALLQRHGEHMGRMLSVEITEGLLLDDRPKVLEQLKQLRAMGMTIALDDFGTGFSSLAYLKKFDIDYIKIDRSFVLDIVHDASDRVIVESIIAMARHLGIRLIAEGVETEDQAELLSGARCHYAQGYLYARPMPAQEFLDFAAAAEREPLGVPMSKRVAVG